MKQTEISFLEWTRKYATEEACRALLEQVRWGRDGGLQLSEMRTPPDVPYQASCTVRMPTLQTSDLGHRRKPCSTTARCR